MRSPGHSLCDVLLTREKYQAMTVGLADSDGPSTGQISFTDWVAERGDSLGRTYASELDCHYR
jgi:hypothetical protein